MIEAPHPISAARFRAMLDDLSVPDAEIARYLTGRPGLSGAFAPAIVPDPALVQTMPAVRSAALLEVLNASARRRRQSRFLAEPPDPDRPVIVAEGDSWLQFPWLIEDVVDHLAPQWRVWCVAAAGDTLHNMVWGSPEYLAALTPPGDEAPRALLFSGTGNDFIGEDDQGRSIIPRILRPYSAGKPAEWYIGTDAFREKQDFVRAALDELLRAVAEHAPGLRVVLLGYDHVRPHEGPGDPREDTLYARRDQWLTAPMRDELHIHDPALRRDIARCMIDALHDILAGLCGGNVAAGAHAHAWHADLRHTLPDLEDWNDEIHPTDDGFRRIAARIAPLL
jgi:hypothetical protein